MDEEQIIFYDSDEAATPCTLTYPNGDVEQVWVVPQGIIKGAILRNEAQARGAGYTHKKCPETGEIFSKLYIYGPTVRARHRQEQYDGLQQVDYKDQPLFLGDEFFHDFDDLLEDCTYREIRSIKGVRIGLPVSFRELDTLYWEDELPEGSLTLAGNKIIEYLITQLNTEIEKHNPAYYESGPVRPTDADLIDMQAQLDKRWAEEPSLPDLGSFAQYLDESDDEEES